MRYAQKDNRDALLQGYVPATDRRCSRSFAGEGITGGKEDNGDTEGEYSLEHDLFVDISIINKAQIDKAGIMNYNNCVRLKNTALAILLGGIIMKRYSAPITEENFSKASKFILDLFRKIKGKNRAYNIVVPLSTVIFIFLSSIFTYGAIYSFSTADDAVIFESLKPVTDIWLFFSDLLIQEGLAWYYNNLICVQSYF